MTNKSMLLIMGATTVRVAVDESMTTSMIAAGIIMTISGTTLVRPLSMKRVATTASSKGLEYVLLSAVLRLGQVGWSLKQKEI